MDNSYDFYYSGGLYRTTVCCSCVGEKQGMLQPSPQAFSARSILDSTVSCDVTERTSPGQRGKRERWECYRLTMFLQTVTSLRVNCFTSIPNGRPPEIANTNPQQENQDFYRGKISSRKHKLLREFYSPIRKIKLSQKLRSTWYLSIEFITFRVFSVQLAFTIWVQQQGYILPDLAAAGSIKKKIMFCGNF